MGVVAVGVDGSDRSVPALEWAGKEAAAHGHMLRVVTAWSIPVTALSPGGLPAPYPIDELEGRITTSLVTPYPPGIPLLIPGERFNATIVRYLKFAKSFNQKFPGFDTDIHGLVEEIGADGKPMYFADCVKA